MRQRKFILLINDANPVPIEFEMPPFALDQSAPEGRRTIKAKSFKWTVVEVAMMKALLIAAAVIAGLGIAVAQDQLHRNKSDLVRQAQQKAPPEKVAPGSLNSLNALSPDAKAEINAPALQLDSGSKKKLPAPGSSTTGQGSARPRP